MNKPSPGVNIFGIIPPGISLVSCLYLTVSLWYHPALHRCVPVSIYLYIYSHFAAQTKCIMYPAVSLSHYPTVRCIQLLYPYPYVSTVCVFPVWVLRPSVWVAPRPPVVRFPFRFPATFILCHLAVVHRLCCGALAHLPRCMRMRIIIMLYPAAVYLLLLPLYPAVYLTAVFHRLKKGHGQKHTLQLQGSA